MLHRGGPAHRRAFPMDVEKDALVGACYMRDFPGIFARERRDIPRVVSEFESPLHLAQQALLGQAHAGLSRDSMQHVSQGQLLGQRRGGELL